MLLKQRKERQMEMPIRTYKNVSMLGASFISEASWETNWFNRNHIILNMILTNDMNIAKKWLAMIVLK